MAKVYFNLIINGRKTIDDVPQKLRLAVETLLEEYYREQENNPTLQNDD